MLRTVDRWNGFEIQKVVDQKGQLVRYQTVPEEKGPGYSKLIQFHNTLKAAREFIGKTNGCFTNK